MRLLLKETVDQLGTIGDIVEVSDGYGRNYLLPKGMAVAVTPENIRRLEAKKADLLKAEAEKRQSMQALADRVKAAQVLIHARAAGEEGKLYGSVNTQQIAEAYQKQGLAVEPRMVLLDQPIKELGGFDVRIRVYAGIEVEAKVWVVEEGATAPPAEMLEKDAARVERAEKSAKEKAAKAEKGEKAEKAEGKAAEKAERAERADKGEGAEKGEKKAPAEKPAKAKK
jgi:large subunit ribosomal protein L9